MSVASTGKLIDRSGTVTLGGTAQSLAPAKTHRRYFLFQNISDTDMWITFDVPAVADQPSIKILANGTFTMEGSFAASGAASLMCATTGKKFVCKEA